MDHRPWFTSYPSDVERSLAPYPERSLYSLLAGAASRQPDASAIEFLGKRLTYRELEREVERLASGLTSLGVKRGDRVGLILPNCPQYVIAHYAILRLGAVVVGNNPLYTERELRHQLQDAGIGVCIVLDQLYPRLAAVRDDAGIDHVVVTKLEEYLPFPKSLLAPLKFRRDARHEGRPWPPVPQGARVRWWRELMREAASPPAPVEVDAMNDLAALVYTGGTTGLSRGAMLTHHNVLSNTLQAAGWFPDLEDGREGMMCVIPFFHSYGMTAAMNVGVSIAGKLILLPRFELDMVLKTIQRERPTLFPGIPRIYVAINESEKTKRYDLKSIRHCISGAAPLPLAVSEKFERITGGRLVEGYGLTEASPVTHANPLSGKRKPGSIGLPVADTDCRLVDVDDPTREADPGSEGELLISGPQVMKGYWNAPGETTQQITQDEDGTRWLHTGDIARIDDEGYFFIVDRKKDVIIVSGFNVYPTEVEEVLYRHEKIEKVSVAGVPDAKSGEVVKAYVVLKEGETATEEEILAFASNEHNGLSGPRVPKRIEIRDSLPETLVGKVLRRVLREEEEAKHPAG